MNTSIDISKSDIREIIELNFFNDLDDLDIPNSKKVKIEEDKDIVKIESLEEVKDIKVEDFQDSEFSENIPGSSDLIEIVKHEINVDDQDNTSHHNEDIDTKHDDEYGCGTPTGNYTCIIIYNMIYIFGPQEIKHQCQICYSADFMLI